MNAFHSWPVFPSQNFLFRVFQNIGHVVRYKTAGDVRLDHEPNVTSIIIKTLQMAISHVRCFTYQSFVRFCVSEQTTRKYQHWQSHGEIIIPNI
jgi:hypothetical protein